MVIISTVQTILFPNFHCLPVLSIRICHICLFQPLNFDSMAPSVTLLVPHSPTAIAYHCSLPSIYPPVLPSTPPNSDRHILCAIHLPLLTQLFLLLTCLSLLSGTISQHWQDSTCFLLAAKPNAYFCPPTLFYCLSVSILIVWHSIANFLPCPILLVC